MRVRVAYWVLVGLFYISIPLAFNADKIALLSRGYGTALAFEGFNPETDRLTADRYYGAYLDAFPVMHEIAVVTLAIWLVAFAVSASAVTARIRRGTIVVPLKLDIITLCVSLGLVVAVLLLAAAASGARALVM